MKASRKWLKVDLAMGVRNFVPASVALKFVEFSLFDNFFFGLPKFQDLDVFSDFLVCSTQLPTLNPSTSLSPTFSQSGVNFSGDTVVFSIKVSGATIFVIS